ncbi:MAG: HYR domain-containing protein, partial [Flavobacteriales bacterium]|nr:HYR domain-containing protein [Flavobacteriales bacterium]
TNIVLTTTDGSSNTANCNFIVVVTDATNPTITCPGNQVGNVDGSCNFTMPDYTGLAIAADNCPGVSVAQVPAPGTIVGVGTTNIVLTATDGSSNTSNCNFDVVVTDVTNPTITCPGNQVGTVDGSCNFSLPDYTSLAIATDNCSGVTVTQVPVPGTIVGVGTTNIILTVTDGSSNTANCNFNIVITDVTNPTITCPGNQIGNVDGSCNFTLPDYTGLAIAADNCPGVSVSQVPVPGTIVGIGTTNIVLTATDGSSNTSNCNFDVVITDGTPPTITCPADQNEPVNASCQFSLPDYTGLAVIADNCSPAPAVTQLPIAGTIITGATVVTLTTDDGNGNTASCNFNAIGIDLINPTITCPANQNESFDATCNITLPDYTGLAVVADNCNPAPAVTQSPVAGTVTSASTTITLTVNDGSGNTASCTFDVIPTDNTNPTITCPGNQTENPDASCNFTLPDYTGLAIASDNCNPAPAITQTPIAGTVISGTTTLTLTADDGNGNTSTCTFDVVLNDATAPTAVCQNINAYLDGTGNVAIAASNLDGGSTDNCSGITFTATQTAFTCADLGPNNVTMTATDGNSNSGNCVAVVTVMDTISPTAVCQNINAYVDGAGNVTIVASDIDGGSTDNCGAVTLSASITAFTCVDLGPNNLTLTVDDGNGNTDVCVAVVTVIDTISPVITCPGNQTENPDASCNFTLPDYTSLVTSTDNCSGSPTITQSPVAATVISGTTTITITADDGNGNNSSCTFDVVFNDITPPTTVCQNINAYLDGAGNVTIVATDLDGGSTDNCGAVTLSASQTAFICADLGPNNVTLTGTDGNTNSSNCVSVVTILDTISPVITCPGNQLENPNAACQFVLPDYTGLGTATDNCSAAPTITQTPVPGTTISGTTTITFIADDGNGNTGVCTFDVVLNDGTAPTAVCQNITVYLDAAGNVTIAASDLDGGSTDNCSGITFTASQTSFTCADLGTNNVTMTATDGNSNADNCVAVVTVIDTVSPVMVCQNINAYLDGAGTVSIVAADLDGGSTDNCGAVT